MIYQKENPVGLDALIAKIQTRLYSDLNTTWGVELEAYERCYILADNDGKKDVKRQVKNKEYELISVAEKNKFFFIQKTKAVKEDMIFFKTDLELIFILDLIKIYPNKIHRADLEVQNDVQSILNQFDNVYVEYIESGYDKALVGINYEQENDMQPYCVFKFNLKVSYDMSETCVC